ncbi:MAG TPA: LysM peptidoglycan-binding domain-containing protein [Gemmatimonadales bacterium]|nr:LysM peptidoglycan-binding domain-containing protein [Gemmatimonadales bacterium]
MTHPRSAVLATVFLAAACGRMQVAATPEPEAPPSVRPVATTAAAPRRAGRVPPVQTPADSVADARALDSLQTIEPGAAIPDLTVSDLTQPTWDLNVEAYADHPRVAYYVDYFTGAARDRFQVWLERMPRYEALVRQELTSRGLPGDLVYLALIESGFSTVAVSRSRAVGMWQFMTATGKGYGLTINAWVDERRDPIKATDAAARYLTDLTRQFGSHYLAAAAYNGGPGRVGRGLLRISALQGGGDEAVDPTSDDMFFELAETSSIHQETKDYVPKLIAAALVAKDPESYGFTVPDDVEPFPLDSVMVAGGTGLDLIARLADTTLEAIRELNPSLLRGMTPPGRPYPVRVPTGMMADVAAAYAATPPVTRPAVLAHVVRRGETVSGIAARYGVSTDLLMSSNRVARARSLQVGTTLYIPTNASDLPATAFYEAEPTPRAPLSHVVRAGETLSAIARQYNVPMETLKANNGIGRDNVIRAGQKLTIRTVASAPARAVARTHTVKRGETAGAIAERYHVGVSVLIQANKLGRNGTIRVGQKLRIP